MSNITKPITTTDTIEEANAKLKKDINDLLVAYNRETRMIVEHISLTPIEQNSGVAKYIVDINARL